MTLYILSYSEYTDGQLKEAACGTRIQTRRVSSVDRIGSIGTDDNVCTFSRVCSNCKSVQTRYAVQAK